MAIQCSPHYQPSWESLTPTPNLAIQRFLLNFSGGMKAEDLESLVDALQDLEVDVEGGHHKVRVFVE